VVVLFEEMECPKCTKNKLVKGKTAVSCYNFKECGFKIPFVLMEKKLTDKQISDLIEKKKTTKIKGLSAGGNEKVEGKFILDETFNIQFEA